MGAFQSHTEDGPPLLDVLAAVLDPDPVAPNGNARRTLSRRAPSRKPDATVDCRVVPDPAAMLARLSVLGVRLAAVAAATSGR
jgi:hypothetical protein